MNNKREFCANAVHRLNNEEPKKLSPNSNIWCEECLEKHNNIPRVPFDPDALRSVG